MKKTILFLLVVAIIGISLLIWYARDEVSVVKEMTSVDMDLSLQGVMLRQGKDGRLLWTLNATHADYQKEQGLIMVTDPDIVYFQEGKDDPVYVTGDQGRIDQKNDQADIWSNVIVLYQGSRLITQSLHYNGTNSQLSFKDHVEVHKDEMVLTADRALVELETKNLKAHGRVHAVVMTQSNPIPQ
jgi:LPS export ABC transporter protein LptC